MEDAGERRLRALPRPEQRGVARAGGVEVAHHEADLFDRPELDAPDPTRCAHASALDAHGEASEVEGEALAHLARVHGEVVREVVDHLPVLAAWAPGHEALEVAACARRQLEAR